MLDNCEHVIATAAEVAEDLLRRCPGLRAARHQPRGAAGRRRDHLAGAAAGGRRRRPALRGPRAGRRRAARALADDLRGVDRRHLRPARRAAARHRARRRPHPGVPDRSRSPLGCNDRFRLLTGGSRTALPRQQTLRAVVDWSYELLFDDEQRVFERLSVFPGGCDLATAEAVCADDDARAADDRRHLHALVDKSLVLAVPRGERPAVHPAADARPVRPREARRAGRRRAHPRRDGGALRAAVRAERRPPSPATSSGRG